MIIKKLAPHEAQKIAAGEVIERPANTLKELVENSLDAGATQITIAVRQGGKTFMSITDNGCGMAPEDARICFERHTTSKISSVDELESINTFGFRGEALASICSVAKVSISTKQKDAPSGIKLSVKDGGIEKEEIIGCQTGTTILVDELFYNVPARKKFLKATTTEWNHILSLFKAFALNNLHVHFMLLHDDSTSYNCPPVICVTERIQQLFEGPLADNAIALKKYNKNGVTITGALTTQEYARYDRGALFFFVNNRWVKNYQLVSAVTKGYLNVLPSGKYPAAIISLVIDPHTIDINVHPKKEEVQFLHPRAIEAAITTAVRETLEAHLSAQLKQNVSLRQEVEPVFFDSHSAFAAPFAFAKNVPDFFAETSIKPQNPFPFPQPTIPASQVWQEMQNSALPSAQEPAQQEFIESEEQLVTTTAQYLLIGQYKKTYLLLEHPQGLFVVDQHAAHERILYERFSERFDNVATVQLLFPHVVTLSLEDIELLTPYLELFISHGIEIEQMGAQQLTIRAIPVFLKEQSFDTLLQETVSWIKELDAVNPQEFRKKLTEKLRAQMACKAAIKAGDTLSQETIDQLLSDLEKTPNRFTCPHGRPTSWLLTVNEIEKKFKRNYQDKKTSTK